MGLPPEAMASEPPESPEPAGLANPTELAGSSPALAQQLFDLTAELVEIPSVSHNEQQLSQHVEAKLRQLPWLSVERVGDNLVARTTGGQPERLILGGHLDTVPIFADSGVGLRIEDDWLWGTGSADMKGGLAVFLMLAKEIPEPAAEVTYVFYAREEVALEHNGLREVFEQRPDLLTGDAAILGEPTGGVIEAGCQGTMRLRARIIGKRAHTARAWMGRNAVHGLAPLLEALNEFEPAQPEVGGCRYHEALQAVSVSGGVAGNVVPDEALVELGYRYAPDKTPQQAEDFVRGFVLEALGSQESVVPVAQDEAVSAGGGSAGSGSASDPASRSDLRQQSEPVLELEVTDNAPPCAPGLDHQLFAKLLVACGGEFRAKLGWTDVSFFGERGIPALNFGPGDPEVSHTPQERVSKQSLEQCYLALAQVLQSG